MHQESSLRDLQVPAIAERIAGQIQDKYHFPEKDNFIAKRKDVIHMEDLTLEEKNALIKENQNTAASYVVVR